MSIASLKVVPEDMRTSIIRIHSYEDKNPQGTFYNLYYGEEMTFGNLTRLLLLMEDMMDEMECPQASVRSRRFGKGQKAAETKSGSNRHFQSKSALQAGSQLAGKAQLDRGREGGILPQCLRAGEADGQRIAAANSMCAGDNQ